MADLSPQAKAVLGAATPALNNLDACGFNHQRYDRKALAAALRAAACEVVPVPIDAKTPEEHWALLGVKNRLLAIADELEGAND